MIYLRNTTELQELFIPISYADPSQPGQKYRLCLFSTVNLNKSVDELLRTADFNADFNYDFARTPLPIRTPGGLYYWATIQLPAGVAPGSYEYALIGADDTAVLSTGNVIIGDFECEPVQYEKPIEYEQYQCDL